MSVSTFPSPKSNVRRGAQRLNDALFCLIIKVSLILPCQSSASPLQYMLTMVRCPSACTHHSLGPTYDWTRPVYQIGINNIAGPALDRPPWFKFPQVDDFTLGAQLDLGLGFYNRPCLSLGCPGVETGAP